MIVEAGRYVGIATNNVAEYIAIIAGLTEAIALDPTAELLVRMDSKLVVQQMAGAWKIKHPDMISLGAEVQRLCRGRKVSWEWIPRDQNARADALANRAMDEQADFTNHLTGQQALQASPEAVATLDTAPNDREAGAVGLGDSAASGPLASFTEFNSQRPSSIRAPQGVTEPLTTIVLIRHGRTQLTESKRISGSGGSNPPLSELGRQDASAAAAAVGQIGRSGPFYYLPAVSQVISSPMLRTRETAAFVADAIGCEVEIESNFAEISFGRWDGLQNDEAIALDPEHFASWQGSWTQSPPGGESLEVFDARLQKGLDNLLTRNAGKSVAVVAHVMPIRGLFRTAAGAGPESYWVPQIAPCSLTILRFWGRQATEIITLNSTAHLVD